MASFSVRDRIKEAITKLETAEGKCPVCRRDLKEHEKNEILKEFNQELARILKDLEKLEKERETIKAKEERYRKIISKEDEIVRLKGKVDELKQIESKLSEKDIEALKKAYEEFEELKGQGNQLIGVIERLKESIKHKSKVESKLEEIRRKIKDKEQEKEEILNEVKLAGFSDLDALKAELETLREVYERWLQVKDTPRKLEEAKEKLKSAKNDLKSVNEQIERLRKDLEVVQNELDALTKEYDPTTHENTRKLYVDKSKELEGVKTKIEGLRSLIAEIESHIEQLKKIPKQVKEYEKKVKIIEEKIIPDLKKIREKFRSYRVTLAEAVLKEVEYYASEIFEELTEGKYSGIVFKRETERNREKLKIYVAYQGKERDISFLSDGELIALGLAFRLALSMFMIKGRIPVLILDEPTPFLDEERRKKLVDIMNGYLKKIPQVIVVSHDDELKDAADRVVLVELSGGVSKVSIKEI